MRPREYRVGALAMSMKGPRQWVRVVLHTVHSHFGPVRPLLYGCIALWLRRAAWHIDLTDPGAQDPVP